MRIHRFYIENIDINENNLFVTQETDLIHQLKNVFRCKTGQRIIVFNETCGEIEVELLKIDKKDMSFKYIRHIENKYFNNKSKKQLFLYMSIIKNSNFDLVIEKAVELGVDKIIPTITERTIKNNINMTRINKIIKEATEQSGRIDLMKVENSVDLKHAIKTAKNLSNTVYFGSVDDNDSNKESISSTADKISVFIGPEGGFSDEEILMLVNNDIKPIRLGNYVLRAETAAIVASGILSL